MWLLTPDDVLASSRRICPCCTNPVYVNSERAIAHRACISFDSHHPRASGGQQQVIRRVAERTLAPSFGTAARGVRHGRHTPQAGRLQRANGEDPCAGGRSAAGAHWKRRSGRASAARSAGRRRPCGTSCSGPRSSAAAARGPATSAAGARRAARAQRVPAGEGAARRGETHHLSLPSPSLRAHRRRQLCCVPLATRALRVPAGEGAAKRAGTHHLHLPLPSSSQSPQAPCAVPCAPLRGGRSDTAGRSAS